MCTPENDEHPMLVSECLNELHHRTVESEMSTNVSIYDLLCIIDPLAIHLIMCLR
jgi:hypothetical protein